jgi:hypothetical protein
MSPLRLKDIVETELALMHEVVKELSALHAEVREGRAPDLRVVTLAAAFLQQFYNGVENILKRFLQFHGVTVADGPSFHRNLLDAFAEPAAPPLPGLLDAALYEELDAYRKFRHASRHAYTIHLDWSRLEEGASRAQHVLLQYELRVRAALNLATAEGS